MIKNTKRAGHFRFVSLGDVHLGHPNTPTTTIIRNLDKYCTNDTVLKDVDMLIITGDLYDRLLHNADDNVNHINRWITKLLYRCAYLNVALRIVEGTPSHDRMQSRFFIEQAENAGIKLDIHYATTLSIEHIPRFGITVLYIPDKWRNDTSETLEEVRTLMRKENLEQVDFAIMHGAFEYQLPEVVKEPTHDSDTYLTLVRYFILIGHVHLPTRKDRILAAGSYDRICHGEEGAKGYYDVIVRSPTDHKVTFVHNKGAKRYDTIACHGLDTKELNVILRKATKDLPRGSALRIKCNPNDVATGDLEAIKAQYPDYEWTLTVEQAKKERKSVLDTFMQVDLSEFIPIDATSINQLVRPELERHAKDPSVLQGSIARFAELIENGVH